MILLVGLHLPYEHSVRLAISAVQTLEDELFHYETRAEDWRIIYLDNPSVYAESINTRIILLAPVIQHAQLNHVYYGVTGVTRQV